MKLVKSESIIFSETEATHFGSAILMLQRIIETASDPENARSASEALRALNTFLDRTGVDTNKPEPVEEPEGFDEEPEDFEDLDENDGYDDLALFNCIRDMIDKRS